MPDIQEIRARLNAAERAARDLEYSDDLACVTGAMARADALVRECRAELAAELARLEPAARDAMAGDAA